MMSCALREMAFWKPSLVVYSLAEEQGVLNDLEAGEVVTVTQGLTEVERDPGEMMSLH